MKDPEPGELWECFEEQRINEDVAEHAIVLEIETIEIPISEGEVDSNTYVIYYDTGFGKVHDATVKQFMNIFKRVTF